MSNDTAKPSQIPRVPACAFAVFDEFGNGADDRVQDYAARLVAAERERCAQVCDLHSRLTWNDDRKSQSRVLAEEIRRWPNTDPQP